MLVSLGSVPDWIQAIGVPVALAYGLHQIAYQVKTHNLQALLFVLQELGGKEMRDLRHWVKKRMPRDPCLMTSNDKEKARTVAVALDRVAFLYKIKALPDEIFYWFMPGEFEQQWDKLKPFIATVRKDSSDGDPLRPKYCRSLEWLAAKRIQTVVGEARFWGDDCI